MSGVLKDQVTGKIDLGKGKGNEDGKNNCGSSETKVCKLCQMEIGVHKYRLHDVMCHKMNYRCSTCEQLVLKSEEHYCVSSSLQDLEEHKEESKEQEEVEISGRNQRVIADRQMMSQSQQNPNAASQLFGNQGGSMNQIDEVNRREIERLIRQELDDYDGETCDLDDEETDVR